MGRGRGTFGTFVTVEANGGHVIKIEAISPISAGDFVYIDSMTGKAYVRGKLGCDICKRNFTTPTGLRIHNGMKHK